VAINPIVERVAKHAPRQKRGLATGLIFVIFAALLALTMFLLIPPLVKQTQVLVQNLPQYLEQIRNNDSVVGQLIDRYHLVDRLQTDQASIINRLSRGADSLVHVLQGVFNGLLAAVTVFVLTFFMLVEGPRWIQRLWSLMPVTKRRHYQPLVAKMYAVVTGYVTGNLLISLIAAVTTAIMLTIIGIPFAIPLGIAVGILDLLPLVGATLGAAVVVLVCLFSSFNSAAIMAIFFAIYQQLENNVLQPLVYGRTVQLSPLSVFIAAILGVALGGILGALVAIPVAACLQILARDYLKNHFND
jgi:predicted PurR-regulated permease PerM